MEKDVSLMALIIKSPFMVLSSILSFIAGFWLVFNYGAEDWSLLRKVFASIFAGAGVSLIIICTRMMIKLGDALDGSEDN